MKTTKLVTKYLMEEGQNRAIVQINHASNSHSIWRIRIKTEKFIEICDRFAEVTLKESKRTIPNVPKNERFKLDEGID